MDSLTFDEVYGNVPQRLLDLFKTKNVSSADWDMMLMRWGYTWGDENLPWEPIFMHIVTHSERGYYQYPMYE